MVYWLKIRVQDVEASVMEDLLAIFEMVKLKPGFRMLNNLINDLLRG
jgi:hypothetical protein